MLKIRFSFISRGDAILVRHRAMTQTPELRKYEPHPMATLASIGEFGANLGVQLQATSFQSELNILEIIELYAGLYGIVLTDHNVTDLLRDIQLEEHARKRFVRLCSCS